MGKIDGTKKVKFWQYFYAHAVSFRLFLRAEVAANIMSIYYKVKLTV